jgi:hypothetical protein
MLDRNVVEEFILEEFREINLRIPKSIKKQELVEAFCQFTEDDYYEWLKDNFKSFFNHSNPDWVWIERYIAEHKNKLTR